MTHFLLGRKDERLKNEGEEKYPPFPKKKGEAPIIYRGPEDLT